MEDFSGFSFSSINPKSHNDTKKNRKESKQSSLHAITPSQIFKPVDEFEPNYRERAGRNNMDCKICCIGFLKFLIWTILFLGLIAILVVWIKDNKTGFSEKKNHHPLIMTVAMIAVTGYSSVIFQICICVENIVQMIIHVFMYTLVLASIIYDLITQDIKISKSSSLHLWLGLITIILFIIDYIIGIIRLFFKHTYCALRYRFVALPLHVNIGIVMYLLAIFTTVTGIEFEDTTATDNNKLMLNLMGVLAILIGFVVAYKVEYAYTSEYEY